jgi:hypothetical protein
MHRDRPHTAVLMSASPFAGRMGFWRALPLALAISTGFWSIGLIAALALSHTA